MSMVVLWFLMGRGKLNNQGRAHKRSGKHCYNVYHTTFTTSATAESHRLYNITEALRAAYSFTPFVSWNILSLHVYFMYVPIRHDYFTVFISTN